MSQPLLNGAVDAEYVEPGSDLGNRIEELDSRLDDLESRLILVKRDAVAMVLNLLSHALKQVAAGKVDISSVASVAGDASSKWEPIKKRLQPRLAEAIDIILVQGPMKRDELRVAMKMNYTNCCNNVVLPLVRQGLLIDSGGKLSLKEL
jgi:hypothetical protein